MNNMDDKRNSETKEITCTMCGKQFDKWDMSLGDNRYDIFVNYPSKYDLKRLRFDFCCSCFDKVLDTIIPMCQNNPVIDEDWWDHCLRSIDGKTYICRNLTTNKKRIYVDMDGVLAEYKTTASIEEMETEGYFRSLRPRTNMIAAVKALFHANVMEIFVLSSVLPQCKEQSEKEKNEWLNEFLPEIDSEHRLFAICGKSKAETVSDISENDILIDDHSPNLESWVKAGGKAIKVLNEVNGLKGTFVTGPRVKIEKPTDLFEAIQRT